MASYRLQFIRCGKPKCKRCRRAPAHGPYWYAFWKESGRSRSAYAGRARPGWQPTGKGEGPHGAPAPRRPSSEDFARLGLEPGATWGDVRTAYKARARELHPDRGGSHWHMVRLNQAFARIKAKLGE